MARVGHIIDMMQYDDPDVVVDFVIDRVPIAYNVVMATAEEAAAQYLDAQEKLRKLRRERLLLEQRERCHRQKEKRLERLRERERLRQLNRQQEREQRLERLRMLNRQRELLLLQQRRQEREQLQQQQQQRRQEREHWRQQWLQKRDLQEKWQQQQHKKEVSDQRPVPFSLPSQYHDHQQRMSNNNNNNTEREEGEITQEDPSPTFYYTPNAAATMYQTPQSPPRPATVDCDDNVAQKRLFGDMEAEAYERRHRRVDGIVCATHVTAVSALEVAHARDSEAENAAEEDEEDERADDDDEKREDSEDSQQQRAEADAAAASNLFTDLTASDLEGEVARLRAILAASQAENLRLQNQHEDLFVSYTSLLETITASVTSAQSTLMMSVRDKFA